MRRIPLRYKVGSALLILLVVLFFLMRESLPHYAARIPLLALLILLEYPIYSFIRATIEPSHVAYRVLLRIIWWFPVTLLLIFLFMASILPLQYWGDFYKIYVPGYAIMTLIAKILLFILLIPAFLLQLTGYILRKGFAITHTFQKTLIILKRMAIILGSLAFMGLFIGSIHWVSKFKTRHVSVSIPDLPDNLNGLKIVQISDIHLGSWASTKPLQRAVDMINELQPDMVFFTGDMVNYSSKETVGFEDVLAQIKAPLGVYAILGNHDYGDYVAWPDSNSKVDDQVLLADFYDRIGWKLLQNEHDILNIKGNTLLIAGVENWSATSRFRKYGDMEVTMRDAHEADVNILLSHDPTHWEAEVKDKYPQFDLTLSGHTHGMQIGFEGFGIKWSPSQYVYKNWGGMYQNVDSNLNVSRLYVNIGLGHIAYPGRVGILPEITLLTLEK